MIACANLKAAAAIVSALALAGCANVNSIYRPLRTTDGTGALIDVKQRAIIAGYRRAESEGEQNGTAVTCSEPSPDAMAAYASELAAKSDKLPLELALASQESAAFVGLRTSAIQLLRDQLFYTCLSYMNGAISAPQHDLMARRYQKHTVALLAIEQLTGAIRSNPATIETSGSAELARSISAITAELASTDATIAALTQKKADAATSAEEKTLIDARLKELGSNKAAMQQALVSNRGSLVSGKAIAAITTTGVNTAPSDAKIAAVADVVKEIVNGIILTDDTPQLCLLKLMGAMQTTEDAFSKYCLKLLDNKGAQARGDGQGQVPALDRAMSKTITLPPGVTIFDQRGVMIQGQEESAPGNRGTQTPQRR